MPTKSCGVPAFVALSLVLLPGERLQAQSWIHVSDGRLDAIQGAEEVADTLVVHLQNLPADPNGAVIRLEVADPFLGDLDIVVLDSVGEAICESSGTGRVEMCWVDESPLPDSVRVKILLYENEGSSEYVLSHRFVQGPSIAGWGLFGDEATPARLDATLALSFVPEYGFGDIPLPQLLVIPRTAEADQINLTIDNRSSTPFGHYFHDSRGAPMEAGTGLLPPGRNVRIAVGEEVRYVVLASEDLAILGDSAVIDVTATAVAAAAPLPVAIGTPTVVDSVGAADLFFRLASGQSAILRLNGRGAEMSVVSQTAAGESNQVSVTQLIDGSNAVAYIGDPAASIEGVMAGVRSSTTVTVSIDPIQDDPRLASQILPPTWSLVAIPSSGDVEALLLRDFPSRVESAEVMSRTGVERGVVSANGLHVFRLIPPSLDRRRQAIPDELPEFSARLLDESNGLRLAVLTSLGRVIDFGQRSVAWDWPSVGQSLYLVILSEVPEDQGFMVELSGYGDRS